MKSKLLTAIICAAMGIGAAAFVFLGVKNLTPAQQEPEEAPAPAYTLQQGANTDVLGEKIDGLVANNLKDAKFSDGVLDSMKPALSASKNLAGWLTIPGTEMDTAVMQGNDNNRYLHYDFYERYTGEMSAINYGNIYLDYRCNNGKTPSKNMVIHGHTTGKSDGIPKQAFRSLYDYTESKHFKKNPIIKYSTLYGEFTYKICAVFYSTALASSDNGYLFNYIYPDMSDNNMVGYIKQVKERMLYETGVSLEPTDKIITLSTCIYVYGGSVDTRLVIVGRMLHEGEDESIDKSLVKDNPDYRRPQVWYSRNGKTNPYKDSERWEPSAE